VNKSYKLNENGNKLSEIELYENKLNKLNGIELSEIELYKNKLNKLNKPNEIELNKLNEIEL